MIVLKGRILTEINVFTPGKIQVECKFSPLLHLKFLFRSQALVVYTFPDLLQLHTYLIFPFCCSNIIIVLLEFLNKYYYSTSTSLLRERVVWYSLEWWIFLAVRTNRIFLDSMAIFMVRCAVKASGFPYTNK